MSLIEKCFGEITIPKAVHRECVVEGEGRPGAVEIASAGWIHVRKVSPSPLLNLLNQELDAGEAEAICLGLETSGEKMLFMDEASGRRKARALGLTVIGSIGLLWRAAREGFIDSFPEALDQLENAGFWISPALKRRILSDWQNPHP